MSDLAVFWRFLSPRRQAWYVLVTALMFAASLAEMVTIGNCSAFFECFDFARNYF